MADPAARHIDTLLLLGLPACGKSVIRRYLSSIRDRSADVGLGPTIQLDDFPYVAFMWQIKDIAAEAGHGPVFFDRSGQRFADLRVWDALIHLINEDYAALDDPASIHAPPAEWVMGRLERAHGLAGMPVPIPGLSAEIRRTAVAGIEETAVRFAEEWSTRSRPPGSTVVIEFSRGGPADAALPMEAPYGYGHALSLLSAQILRRAAVLYVWVTPEQSRYRNHERARPNAQGTILHHAVPDAAMDECYGGDDMDWLIEHGEEPDAISIHTHGSTYHLPMARFDNRREVETFRSEDATEGPELDERTSASLHAAFAGLARPA